jgi:pyruvate,water dikinase
VVDKHNALILWFDQINIDDVKYVGGKNASLGEMYTHLTHQGVAVPNGFAITAKAYFYILEKAGLMAEIKEVLSGWNLHNIQQLQKAGHKIRELIRTAEIPPDLRKEICSAYRDLCGSYNKDRSDIDVAVRSSATAEDLPDASFAGQQETYLNIRGEAQLLDACKKCFASLFTNRAISYRQDKGFDHFIQRLALGMLS